MKITGQLDVQGKPMAFTQPIAVNQFGNTLRDSDGISWAVKDEYGDWVSPTMKRAGVKSVMQVEQTP